MGKRPAFVKTALPSASMRILSPTFTSLAQALITKASFTDTHAIVSTPAALISSAFSTNPGQVLQAAGGCEGAWHSQDYHLRITGHTHRWPCWQTP